MVGGKIADRTTAPGVLTNPSGGTDGTTAVVNTEAYDFLKVGDPQRDRRRTSSGTHAAPVPNVFGMNFQSVSVGQKLRTEPTPVTGADTDSLTGKHGGYTDAVGTPGPLLSSALDFVDHSLGLMVANWPPRACPAAPRSSSRPSTASRRSTWRCCGPRRRHHGLPARPDH